MRDRTMNPKIVMAIECVILLSYAAIIGHCIACQPDPAASPPAAPVVVAPAGDAGTDSGDASDMLTGGGGNFGG